MADPSAAVLVQQDRNHLIHPQYHPNDHEAIIFKSGKGAVLTSVDGKDYIDGLSCLWNVAIGHGNEEMADAAFAQMRELQYANNSLASRTSRPSSLLLQIADHLPRPERGVLHQRRRRIK